MKDVLVGWGRRGQKVFLCLCNTPSFSVMFSNCFFHNPTLVASPSSSSNAQQCLFAAHMGTKAHNLTRVYHAHCDCSCLYLSHVEVYTWSDIADCKDEFEDLFLNNFILAQKRVAHRSLDRLELNKNQRA